MLNFKNTNIVFVTALSGMIAWDVYRHVPWYCYLIVALIYSALLAYGSMQVASGFYMSTMNAGSAGAKQLAITFDDGPADSYTSGILDLLDKYQAPAAFFCIGKNIAGRESILVRLIKSGHLVGNHSFSHHFWFDLYGAEKMKDDLVQMNQACFEATGLRLKLFRPPYGVTNPNLAKAVRELGMTTIGWSLRSMDTVVKDPQKLLRNTLKAVKPGAVVLFHDTCEATFLMLPAFIEAVRRQGFEIVSLDKLLGVEAYAEV
ncbi:MAG: polysaccharide deacetylase family protein [Chitinophagaceae bacterium]|nr:MAG: polysaccharide deacetylase family protein [Chitinophagaceae bacterium]